ncbi:Hypothetical predicted protein [Mytilus galloprovincialis]|uniref:Uncharacterized protein n=1 Tax=Mytilus galloprovincialis TaxID=29158 RepID=A0A8B6GS54_MYTGA|nr:Hypothetical predicted protein [Mytilus galloprovincialis]
MNGMRKDRSIFRILLMLLLIFAGAKCSYMAALQSGDGVCERTMTRKVFYTAYTTRLRWVCNIFGRNCYYLYFIVSVKQTRTETVVTPVCCEGYIEEDEKCISNDLRYWRRNAKSQSNGNKWSPPNKQADRIDIETTAYALLTYTKTKSFGDGSSVVRWLMTQRNPNGGFTSTQDTVIALESISEFTAVVHSQQPNMAVSIVSGSFRKDFTVNSLNALVLQAVELPQPFPQQVQIQVTGSGMALVEVAVFYNVNADLGDPSFDVSVSIQEETIDLIETKTCTRWNRGGTSGMAVQEIGIPTGFEPNTNEIGSVRNLKRIEKDKRKVVLYFDEVSD